MRPYFIGVILVVSVAAGGLEPAGLTPRAAVFTQEALGVRGLGSNPLQRQEEARAARAAGLIPEAPAVPTLPSLEDRIWKLFLLRRAISLSGERLSARQLALLNSLNEEPVLPYQLLHKLSLSKPELEEELAVLLQKDRSLAHYAEGDLMDSLLKISVRQYFQLERDVQFNIQYIAKGKELARKTMRTKVRKKLDSLLTPGQQGAADSENMTAVRKRTAMRIPDHYMEHQNLIWRIFLFHHGLARRSDLSSIDKAIVKELTPEPQRLDKLLFALDLPLTDVDERLRALAATSAAILIRYYSHAENFELLGLLAGTGYYFWESGDRQSHQFIRNISDDKRLWPKAYNAMKRKFVNLSKEFEVLFQSASQDQFDALADYEKTLLAELRKGVPIAELVRRLFLGARTIETYIFSIQKKLVSPTKSAA